MPTKFIIPRSWLQGAAAVILPGLMVIEHGGFGSKNLELAGSVVLSAFIGLMIKLDTMWAAEHPSAPNPLATPAPSIPPQVRIG